MAKKEIKVLTNTDKFNELLFACNKAEKPNPKAREELKAFIKNNPEFQKRLRRSQDLYLTALENRLEAINGSDTFKEVLHEKCRQLREELGYPTNNSLENLAIDQVILCYVNYHCTDIQYNNNLSKQHNTESGLYWEKRLTFTSRRYSKALELLSKMRKMKLFIQVNNATNQIVSNKLT